MTTYSCTVELLSASDTRLLGAVLSLKLRSGDCVALQGDLGAGKSTLARAIIRAVRDDNALDVPSPTYALMHSYATTRFEIRHYDLYRLADASELQELGFAEDQDNDVCLIEWPEKAAAYLSQDLIQISLSEIWHGEIEGRAAKLTATGPAAVRMARAVDIWFFLSEWLAQQDLANENIEISYVPGDASIRSYARLKMPDRNVILMDSPRQPDGPAIRGGLPYSRIAHLAEDICPFIAVGAELERRGCSVPATYHTDTDGGLAVIEDLGSAVFGDLIAGGQDIEPLYRAALDVLVQLAKSNPPFEAEGHGCRHVVRRFDQAAMEIELELLLDWYMPFSLERPATDEERQSFLAAWRKQFARLERKSAWVLRDFHSPNLIWLHDREGYGRVGLIDYQDALVGHPAYDVVSLLQDARLDIAREIEQRLLGYYENALKAAGLVYDEVSLRHAYAVFGAQRNIKILGIFARLAIRDGKPQYVFHMPRLSEYLQRCLEHPELQEIHAWFAACLPQVLKEDV